ncbi:MAG: hotdog fold thioesterase [Desulfobacterales bacterium]|nr:hotdog fold thioesterase [Desulfobacterales bacterium]
MEKIKEFIVENDRFAKLAGIELLEVAEGTASARMKITRGHLNGVNTVHGGAIFTLADLAFAAASNSHGTVAVAINVSIAYIKALGRGTLFARAREVSRNPKLALYLVDITDEGGDLVATFQGMVYRKKEKLLEVNPQ